MQSLERRKGSPRPRAFDSNDRVLPVAKHTSGRPTRKSARRSSATTETTEVENAAPPCQLDESECVAGRNVEVTGAVKGQLRWIKLQEATEIGELSRRRDDLYRAAGCEPEDLVATSGSEVEITVRPDREATRISDGSLQRRCAVRDVPRRRPIADNGRDQTGRGNGSNSIAVSEIEDTVSREGHVAYGIQFGVRSGPSVPGEALAPVSSDDLEASTRQTLQDLVEARVADVEVALGLTANSVGYRRTIGAAPNWTRSMPRTLPPPILRGPRSVSRPCEC